MMCNKISRYIKRIFGIYKPGYEYWISLDKIHIPQEFTKTRIGNQKWKSKWRYYRRTGKLQSRILLTKDFTLVDGYSSYKIANITKMGKIPVWFVDWLDEE